MNLQIMKEQHGTQDLRDSEVRSLTQRVIEMRRSGTRGEELAHQTDQGCGLRGDHEGADGVDEEGLVRDIAVHGLAVDVVVPHRQEAQK
jgi:hypothetical protein